MENRGHGCLVSVGGMSQQATPPVPPGQRKPQNWFGIGCYAAIAVVAILVIAVLVAVCSPHGA